MIPALAAILLCQLAGEALARGVGLPVPGPVIGMALMLVLLVARDFWIDRLPGREGRGGSIESTGRGLLSHLSLLFVPAGVGVIQNLQVFGHYGAALAVALLISTALAMIATVYTFLFVARIVGSAPDPDNADP
jgi:holin-like protein